MSKRRSAAAQQSETIETQNGEITDTQPAEGEGVYFEAPPIEQAAAPLKRRRQQTPAAPLELDPQFIANPERMKYALLLALLLRQKGTAKFSAKDMEHVDTDYNILFARTLDGQHLEVTVVSAESGIIRSPERERQQSEWKAKEDAARMSIYQPMPPGPETGHPAAALFALHGMDPNAVFQQQYNQPASPHNLKPPDQAQTEQTQAGTVVAFPTDPQKAPAGSAPYHFPFDLGGKPDTSGPVNLDLMQHRLLRQDQEVAAQEQAAIERQERGEQ